MLPIPEIFKLQICCLQTTNFFLCNLYSCLHTVKFSAVVYIYFASNKLEYFESNKLVTIFSFVIICCSAQFNLSLAEHHFLKIFTKQQVFSFYNFLATNSEQQIKILIRILLILFVSNLQDVVRYQVIYHGYHFRYQFPVVTFLDLFEHNWKFILMLIWQ